MTVSKVKHVAIYVTVVILSCGCSCGKHASNECIVSDVDMRNADFYFSDFWASIIAVPCGQTNAVFYAGTEDGCIVLFHETSAGIHKWNLKNANIEKTVVMPYTDNRDKWILLKDTGEERFHHWDWHREIEDFIQSQPQKSALVKHISTFYRIDGDISEGKGCIFVVDEFLVESTLCDALNKGDKICAEQLYDGSKESIRSIRLEALRSGNRIVGRRSLQDDSLCFAYWDKAKFIHLKELPPETAFIIDNEIVATFGFLWHAYYDDLLEFDEKFAQDAYIKRTQKKRWEGQRNEIVE